MGEKYRAYKKIGNIPLMSEMLIEIGIIAGVEI